jgi:hypothetical protein
LCGHNIGLGLQNTVKTPQFHLSVPFSYLSPIPLGERDLERITQRGSDSLGYNVSQCHTMMSLGYHAMVSIEHSIMINTII